MKICQLELLCHDLAATRTFYVDTLQLPVVCELPGSLTVRAGWTDLIFVRTDTPVAPYHFAFNVATNSLETLIKSFLLPYLNTAFGQRIATFTDWRARACYFRDAAGNLVEFIERRDALFGGAPSQLFQGVSEIGLAVDDVTALTRYLVEEFALPQFSKMNPLPDFNAVGDDFGLFILARTGRKWLFTDVPAEAQPCKVLFTDCYNLPHLLTFRERKAAIAAC